MINKGLEGSAKGFTGVQEKMKHLQVCHAKENPPFLQMAGHWPSEIFHLLYYLFLLGGLCHLILRKPRQGSILLLLSYFFFHISLRATRPKALWGIWCRLGNS